MNESYSRKSFIKDIYLELPDYEFRHKSFSNLMEGTHEEDSVDNFEFIGREESKQKIIDIILNGTNNGAYLVCGYRGMGKTSFVNKVLKECNKELREKKLRNLKQVNVSFGKSNLVYTDLLKQLIVSLKECLLSPYHKIMLKMIRSSHFIALAALIFLITCVWKFNFLKPLPAGTFISYLIIAGIFSIVLSFVVLKIATLIVFISPAIRAHDKLNRLYARSGSEISEEESIQSIVKNVNVGLFPKSTVKYPPLTSKEMELELIEIIRRIDRTKRRRTWLRKQEKKINDWLATIRYEWLRHYRENMYVFVFDELDKIEPGIGGEEYYKEMKQHRSEEYSMTYIDEQRDRREMMVNIISSLKNLITESRAKFIFITGREMFEASLADIADRQSSIGSIFHKIIYIDSFLKDQQGEDPSGLSNLIENYLKNILLPKDFKARWEKETAVKGLAGDITQHQFLLIYNDFLNDHTYPQHKDLSEGAKNKIILTLQQYSIFLTYRSNGSPKKLTRLIEEHVISEDIFDKPGFTDNLPLVIKASNTPVDGKRTLYLQLNYYNQFRFGFITYIYRPFLLNYNRRLKNYSDYLLVSTTYLVDHILKFHPVAFSTRNLELLPEVLSTNRTPQLRSFIDELISFLSYSYIRDTEIRLFEFKFHNKVANEILYLTNLFEDESAAFNFTLDESYPIKLHIKSKILELRRIYKDVKLSNEYDFIHSISALNNLLGDLRYFDQEYNDAITAYSDALQALRNIKEEEKRPKIEIVVLIIQLQLKIGHTYEKIKTYENSMAYFSDAMEYARETLLKYCENESGVGEHASRISIYELLQTSLQAFMANLYLIEKTSPNGITLQQIRHTINILKELFDKVNNYGGPPNNYHSGMLKSVCFQHIAVMAFYKNLFIKGIKKHPDLSFCGSTLIEDMEDDLVKDRGNQRSEDFRFPNLSFFLNIMALREQINYFRDLNLKKRRKEIESIISHLQLGEAEKTLVEAFELIIYKDPGETSDKFSRTSMAIVLGRIGDILLSNIDTDPTQKGNPASLVHLSQVIDTEMIDLYEQYERGEFKLEDLFTKMLFLATPILARGITGDPAKRIQLMLICYYMSSKFYSAAGKMSNCSSQLKKIMRLLTAVINVDPFEDPCSKKPETMSKGDYYARITDFIETQLLAEILKNISTNSNSTDRSQILRYKSYRRINSIHFPIGMAKNIYANLSNNPEIREALILFGKLKIMSVKLNPDTRLPIESLLPEQEIVSCNNIIASQWTRVMELEFQAALNDKILKEYICPRLSKKLMEPVLQHSVFSRSVTKCWNGEIYPVYSRLSEPLIKKIRTTEMTIDECRDLISSDFLKDGIKIKGKIRDKLKEKIKENVKDPVVLLGIFFNHLKSVKVDNDTNELVNQFANIVCNSIHCLNHITEILQTYGPNYPASLTHAGDHYKKLGIWMQWYYLAIEFQKTIPGVKMVDPQKEVEALAGIESARMLEPLLLYQKAILNYRRAIELHHEGNTYKNKIQSLNYLDDDFNDSVDHFAAALERSGINSGRIRRSIERLDKILGQSQLFKYRSYVNDL